MTELVVRAPGRVNLIGEHTDYNDGFVLPAAIDRELRISYRRTDDRRVVLTRLDEDETLAFDLDAIGPSGGSWIDYPQGVARELAVEGIAMTGLRGTISSTLPISSGLSSSAALEVASAWALSAQHPPPIDPMALAKACQRAENRYVGVRSGLMDQFAVVFGRPDAALLLDCRALLHEEVRLPLERARLVICDSRAPRDLASSAYNTRRSECEDVVGTLQAAGEPVAALRDVDGPMLERHAHHLDPIGIRRARHVVRENERVGAVVEALRQGDLLGVGRLFAASHRSLRDLYEVSSPELDALVTLAEAVPGMFASRMTGAGFGGCTINLVAPEAVDRFAADVHAGYLARTGLDADIQAVSLATGAGMA